MRYTVINGDISIGKMTIDTIATSSTLMVGDTKCVSLLNFFEGPPETVIVGVVVPVVPLGEK